MQHSNKVDGTQQQLPFKILTHKNLHTQQYSIIELQSLLHRLFKVFSDSVLVHQNKTGERCEVSSSVLPRDPLTNRTLTSKRKCFL